MNSKLIIDANVASEFPNRTPEATAIVQWLRRRGKLATGGKNLRELFLINSVRRLVQELFRAGRAFKVDQDELHRCERNVFLMEISSDDPHILALAIVSGARILYTRDDALIRDFTNRNFISNPKGKCYLNAIKHPHLLK